MDSDQFGMLRDQQLQKGTEQAFTPAADVRHELEEAQVQRSFLLREATRRSPPGTEPGPKALQGVDLNLMEAIPVLVPGVFAPAVTHGVMIETPILQRVINRVFIGMNARAGGDQDLDQRPDRRWLDIFQPSDDHHAAPLDHSEHRRLFLLQGAPAPRALPPAPPPPAALFFHHIRKPFMTGHDVDFVAFHVPRQNRFGRASDDSFPQLLGHPLPIVRVQAPLLGDLGVRSV